MCVYALARVPCGRKKQTLRILNVVFYMISSKSRCSKNQELYVTKHHAKFDRFFAWAVHILPKFFVRETKLMWLIRFREDVWVGNTFLSIAFPQLFCLSSVNMAPIAAFFSGVSSLLTRISISFAILTIGRLGRFLLFLAFSHRCSSTIFGTLEQVLEGSG